jgi:hypothetical protein
MRVGGDGRKTPETDAASVPGESPGRSDNLVEQMLMLLGIEPEASREEPAGRREPREP